MWPAMWRFHQVHHSDPFVDVTTTYRTHPVETVWRFLFAIVPVWLLGIPAQAVVIQRLLQATNGVIEHANIRLWPPLDRRPVARLGDAERPQDSPFARGLRNQLELREPADALRPPARHVHAGGTSGSPWSTDSTRRCARAGVVPGPAVDAVSGVRSAGPT